MRMTEALARLILIRLRPFARVCGTDPVCPGPGAPGFRGRGGGPARPRGTRPDRTRGVSQ
ncbi:hypothetical protein SSCG_06152 [Streptomyces clavuligerus]|nr:hypothetical protein SSCG_06152 [Streptomyces clavuligerus]